MENCDLLLNQSEEFRFRKRVHPLVQKLLKVTKFTKEEIYSLLIIYYKLTKITPMNRKRFAYIMHNGLNIFGMLVDRMFAIFAGPNSKVIDMYNWVLNLNIMLKGSLQDKIVFCFKVYDLHSQGAITPDFMSVLMGKTIIKKGGDINSFDEESITDLIEILIRRIDLGRDGVVQLDEFSEAVQQNPNLLMCLGICQPMLPACNAFIASFSAQELARTLNA